MKANVAAIMIAHTVQYQSEPRTVMAICAEALLTASSVGGVRRVSVHHVDGRQRNVPLT